MWYLLVSQLDFQGQYFAQVKEMLFLKGCLLSRLLAKTNTTCMV